MFDFFKGMDMSEEAVLKRRKESFETTKRNPENMSNWLHKIVNSKSREKSILQVPETKIIQLDIDWWSWLISDRYSEDKIKEFNDYVVGELGDFRENEVLFMKTGVFSYKFRFHTAVIDNKETIGKQFLDMFYNSMIVGADHTSEIVFREMVKDQEGCLTIYSGMPLHTEYRVFYDFDNKEVVGISNYWHPEEMEKYLNGENAAVYKKEKERIVFEYNQHKEYIMDQVSLFMDGVTELSGKWSVDVMKNGEDFWLIDMARMERSALVDKIEYRN